MVDDNKKRKPGRPPGSKNNPCRPFWPNPADEMRFLRFMGLAYDCANARAPYETPKLAAVASSSQQAPADDDDDGIDPREKLKDIVRSKPATAVLRKRARRRYD